MVYLLRVSSYTQNLLLYVLTDLDDCWHPHLSLLCSFQKAIEEQKIDLKEIEKEVIGTDDELKHPAS